VQRRDGQHSFHQAGVQPVTSHDHPLTLCSSWLPRCSRLWQWC
jgi:hypothetical protein